ncbi:hypothetical protein BaRGS_00024810 [Batillaria attramentaria]|uniref:Uncharacterized protein n=1 Tax=Batillaria attramentaria TaxID=370345 RepID=A0ABD0K9Y8_9CAEN
MDLNSGREAESENSLNRNPKIFYPNDIKSYDPSRAQEILDSSNRDLEDLRSRVLKSSVRCHTLEVDLATQFSPHIQQLLANAKEACQQCALSLEAKRQPTTKPAADTENTSACSETHANLSMASDPSMEDTMSVSGEENIISGAEN